LVAVSGSLFFIPHEFVVPEWRIQVVDKNGQPVPGAVVHQEWTHPVVDGMIFADSRIADLQGRVTLPRRSIRTTVGLGILSYPLCRTESCPSAHAFVCWNDQAGDIFWDNSHRELDRRLPLRVSSCPYG
jgi:hypothetical protein